MDELTEQEEIILLLTKVAEHYPGLTIEVLEMTYIDAILEINMMTPEQKRSVVDEKIQMLRKLQQPDGYEVTSES